MPKIYCDGNPRMVAYVVDEGGSGYTELPAEVTSMEAEYISILYGLNEFFNRWNKELDARYSDLDPETKEFVDKVGTPSDRTPRPLPPPILILNDNETVVKQLSRQNHIGNDRLRELASQIWKMTGNVEVKFQWVPRAESLAGKMLK